MVNLTNLPVVAIVIGEQIRRGLFLSFISGKFTKNCRIFDCRLRLDSVEDKAGAFVFG